MGTGAAASFNPRLRRLRRRLLAVSSSICAVGIGVLAVQLVRMDGESRIDLLDAELDLRAEAARSLIYYEDGVIQLDGISDDEALNGSPQLFVTRLDGGLRFTNTERDFELDLSALGLDVVAADTGGPAAAAHPERFRIDTDGYTMLAFVDDASGRTARVLGRPLRHDDTELVDGAILIVGDPGAVSGPHRAMARTVAVGSVSLLTGLVALLWVVITRSLAPAVQALTEQERFVGDAAHELRKPLTSIRAVAEHSLAAGGEREALRRTVTVVEDASAMLENLLALARLDVVGDGRVVDLEPARLDLLVEAAIEGRRGVRLVAPAPVVVEVVPALVERAVVNLVDNALLHGNRPVEVVVGRDGILVRDRGPGFPGGGGPAHFERFHTGAAGGSGLGLSLVAAVARIHGGSVEARDRLDGPGAEVALHLTRRRVRPGSTADPRS